MSVTIPSPSSRISDAGSQVRDDSSSNAEPVARMPSESGSYDDVGQPSALEKEADKEAKGEKENTSESLGSKLHDASTLWRTSTSSLRSRNNDTASTVAGDEHQRKHSKADQPFEAWEREEMEKLLNEVRGHLGTPPTLYQSYFWPLIVP